MKNILLIIVLTISIIFFSCKKENSTQVQTPIYQFEAVSKGVGEDCKTNLIQFTNNFALLDSITGFNGDIFYALNLPDNMKPVGTTIKLNIRKPNSSELLNCTTMGPTWGQVYVLETELIQTIK